MFFLTALLLLFTQDQEIPKLIEQLGNESIETRENASRRLIQIGEPALIAVQAAIKSVDPEVAARANAAVISIIRNIKIKKVFTVVPPITFKADNITVADLISKLSKLTGTNINCSTDSINGYKTSVDFQNVPLMQAIDIICREIKDAGWYYDPEGNLTFSLIDALPNRPAYYDSGLRTRITSIGCVKHTNFNGTTAGIMVHMDMTLEAALQLALKLPKEQAYNTYNTIYRVTVDSIIDDHDTTLITKATNKDEETLLNKIQSLSQWGEGHRMYAIGLHQDAKKLKLIAGKISYRFPIDTVKLSFDGLDTTSVECGDYIAQFDGTDDCHTKIKISHKNGESINIEKAIIRNTLELVDKTGGKHTSANVNENDIYLYGQEVKSLKFEIINEYYEHDFKFEFKDIPLY